MMTMEDLYEELAGHGGKPVIIELNDGRRVTSSFRCFSWRGSYKLPAASFGEVEDMNGYPAEEAVKNLEDSFSIRRSRATREESMSSILATRSIL